MVFKKMKKIAEHYHKQFIKFCRRRTEKAAQNYLRKNKVLNSLIDELSKQSKSFGLSNYEYVALYQMVRKIKPVYALECGTGKSTYIIAHAMCMNGNGNKLVTMEESEEWTNAQKKALSHMLSHKQAGTWFPGLKDNFIELIHSATTSERHRIWEGSRYKDVKDYPYSFIMVDGPALTDEYFLNMDLIKVLKTNTESISVWLEGRWAIVAMCQSLFGDKVIHRPGWTHTEVYGAAREDLFKHRQYIREEMYKMVKRI
jgi:hypothetical protein